MGRNQTGPRRGGHVGSAGHTTARRAAITLRRKHEGAMKFSEAAGWARRSNETQTAETGPPPDTTAACRIALLGASRPSPRCRRGCPSGAEQQTGRPRLSHWGTCRRGGRGRFCQRSNGRGVCLHSMIPTPPRPFGGQPWRSVPSTTSCIRGGHGGFVTWLRAPRSKKQRFRRSSAEFLRHRAGLNPEQTYQHGWPLVPDRRRVAR